MRDASEIWKEGGGGMKCKLCGAPYDPEEGPECDCAALMAQWEMRERYKDEYRKEYDGKGGEER